METNKPNNQEPQKGGNQVNTGNDHKSGSNPAETTTDKEVQNTTDKTGKDGERPMDTEPGTEKKTGNNGSEAGTQKP